MEGTFMELYGSMQSLSSMSSTYFEQYEKVEQEAADAVKNIGAACTRKTEELQSDYNWNRSRWSELLSDHRDAAQKAFRRMDAVLEKAEIPEIKRREEKCRSAARSRITEDFSSYTADQAWEHIYRCISEYSDEIEKLKYDFFTGWTARAVTRAVPAYHREIHMKLAVLRETVLRCQQVIDAREDLPRLIALADREQQLKLAALQQNAQAQTLAVRNKADQEKKRLEALSAQGMELLTRKGLFANHGIRAGTMVLEGGGKTLRLPVTCSRPEGCYLFCRDGLELTGWLCNLAVDLLAKEPETHVILADVSGLGSHYQGLNGLEESGKLEVWRTESQMEEGMKRLTAAAVTSARDSAQMKYCLFMDDVDRNLPDRLLDSFELLVRNAGAVGLSLWLGKREGAEESRKMQERWPAIAGGLFPLYVRSGVVSIAPRLGLEVPRTVDRQRLARAENLLHAAEKQQACLPMGCRLPRAGCWQRGNAAGEIRLTVGVTDTGAAAELVIDKDHPYALVVGDVSSGKSSLFNNIILQTMANYGPDQVRLVLGDFKMGAEFNVYARRKLKSVEAVVSDEDRDVQDSFLQYCLNCCAQRQERFEETGFRAGREVKNYEEFRQVWEEMGCPGEAMPRILLIIDEYQRLFDDNTGTARLMALLVQRARTYGVHILMASQQATSDSGRSSFTPDLKNFFTYRIAFKCSQSMAKKVFSESCADTGRPNSGIAAAALLKKGHCVCSSYKGETECNRTIQCFYADSNLIETCCQVLSRMNGQGSGLLLRSGEPSRQPAVVERDRLVLGDSPRLHADGDGMAMDDISDDGLVSVRTSPGMGVLVTGADERVHLSMAMTAVRYGAVNSRPVHVFGSSRDQFCRDMQILCHEKYGWVQFHLEPEAQKEALASQGEGCVNILMGLSGQPCYGRSLSGLRVSPESELLEQAAERADLTILCERKGKTADQTLHYLTASMPIRIAGVGDPANIRSTFEEVNFLGGSDFDHPSRSAIRAYYCNQDTGKRGKVRLFLPA